MHPKQTRKISERKAAGLRTLHSLLARAKKEGRVRLKVKEPIN